MSIFYAVDGEITVCCTGMLVELAPDTNIDDEDEIEIAIADAMEVVIADILCRSCCAREIGNVVADPFTWEKVE